MPITLKPGDPAPDFSLPATGGEMVSLKGLRGKKVVLYFYPKDSTPGCTVEACSFRDNHDAIVAAGAVVLGVSADSLRSHENFTAKQSLNFPLLSDEGAAVSTAYGSWGEKKLYGRTFMGMNRSTFLIDEEGRIVHVWAKVKPAGHAEEVLAVVKGG
jgi:peroxiredoxin Q/BCP